MCILLVNHRGILLAALIICNVFSASTIEQRVVLSEERLWEFRDQGRPLATHKMVRNFLDDMYYGTILDDRPVLYLHADVYSPSNVQLYPMYCFTIYNMFLLIPRQSFIF